MVKVITGLSPAEPGPGLQRMVGEQRRKYLVRMAMAQLKGGKPKTAVILHIKALNKEHCDPPLLVKDMPAFYEEARKKNAMQDSPLLDAMEEQAAEGQAAIEATDPDKVALVITKARELFTTDRQIKALEATLVPLKERQAALEHTELPDAMKDAGVPDEFPLADGWKIKRRATLSAKLPTPAAIAGEKDPDKKAELEQRLVDGLKFLEETGNRGLIKDQFQINLGKGETNRAKGIESFLTKRGMDFVHDKTVHPQTLGAFAREAIAEGKELPMEILGVHTAVSVKLVPPKEPKT